ncbi:MAG TPA: pilus assembly protein TadG-related protein [Candidatus Limnocylindrales bacterium]|nr:pilus assembly protein TadG-related protein [Candidatus Limnocylindrales bacterium]
MTRPTPRGRPTELAERRPGERGQLLAIFALAMVGLIGMVGLIIDGGDTALQRRDQQNVADAAAMAAGYAYVNEQDEVAAARSVAAANGYTHGTNNTTVEVLSLSDRITVNVSRPHRNYFSGILGFPSWNVTTTASVVAGQVVAAYGLMPLIFNQVAWEANRDPANPSSFGEPPSGNADIPLATNEFNWTLFCTANGTGCNGNTSTIGEWINADGVSTTVTLSDQINPLNAGSHEALYSDASGAIDESFPVAIVDDDGHLTGFALFHLTGSVGGSTKQISGYFDETLDAPQFKVLHGHGSSTGPIGKYGVELID